MQSFKQQGLSSLGHFAFLLIWHAVSSVILHGQNKLLSIIFLVHLHLVYHNAHLAKIGVRHYCHWSTNYIHII